MLKNPIYAGVYGALFGQFQKVDSPKFVRRTRNDTEYHAVFVNGLCLLHTHAHSTQAEERVRSEPRLTVPKICLGFIADSLFSSTLIGSCKTKRSLSGLPRKTRWEKMAGNIDPGSDRPFIKVNHPAPTDIEHRVKTVLNLEISVTILP